MGYLFTKARTSTIWFLSDHVEDSSWVTTQTLENWRAARNMREIVVVALEGNLQQQDYLEFHFTRDLAYSEKLELESLMPTLVRAWAGRKAGLVTQAQMDDRMIRARQAAAASKLKPDAPILGMSNPAKLTRAEFRVCVMLSRGLSVKALTDELGLSESTIRSHLRSIYSKTEVSGMQELMYRILSAAPEESGRARGRL
jgi:DNA-binding NarL/FixJ family response regulator